MTTPEPSTQSPTWLTAQPITKVQKTSTRLRMLLALLPAAVLAYFVRTRRPEVWALAVAVALFGEFMQVWASSHLHKNVTMINSGPYSLLRNPMYFGRFFVGLGFVLLLWKWYLVALYVVSFALYAQARVLGEEKRLRGLFGEPYVEYCRNVNRWFPWPRRAARSDRRWSWEAVNRNHQLRVTAGVVLALALLWCRANWLGR